MSKQAKQGACRLFGQFLQPETSSTSPPAAQLQDVPHVDCTACPASALVPEKVQETEPRMPVHCCERLSQAALLHDNTAKSSHIVTPYRGCRSSQHQLKHVVSKLSGGYGLIVRRSWHYTRAAQALLSSRPSNSIANQSKGAMCKPVSPGKHGLCHSILAELVRWHARSRHGMHQHACICSRGMGYKVVNGPQTIKQTLRMGPPSTIESDNKLCGDLASKLVNLVSLISAYRRNHLQYGISYADHA